MAASANAAQTEAVSLLQNLHLSPSVTALHKL